MFGGLLYHGVLLWFEAFCEWFSDCGCGVLGLWLCVSGLLVGGFGFGIG